MLLTQVRDPYLLIYIAVRADEDGLKRIRQAYPLCFLEKPNDRPGPVPLTLFRRLLDEHCQDGEAGTHDASDFADSDGIKQLGFPRVVYAHTIAFHYDGLPHGTLVMPRTVIERYDAIQEAVGGQCFPQKLYRITIGDMAYYVGYVNPNGCGAGNEMYRYVELWPVILIDVDTVDAIIDV